jgi:hypothetical protein
MYERGSAFRFRAVIASATLGVVIAACSAVPRAVDAGTYGAVGCEVGAGAFMPETARFSAVGSPWAGNGCSSFGAPWLFVGATAPFWSPSAGSYGEWSVSAPPGLRFRRGWFQAFPKLSPGMNAAYRYRLEGTPVPTDFQRITAAAWYDWPAPGAGVGAVDQLALRATCIDGGKSCF